MDQRFKVESFFLSQSSFLEEIVANDKSTSLFINFNASVVSSLTTLNTKSGFFHQKMASAPKDSSF